jgi:hypothetical protein
MELFANSESYRIETVVEDSRVFILKNNPIMPEESKEDYKERVFWLINDEIERRILISGKKRPDYSKQNIIFGKSTIGQKKEQIMQKNLKKFLTY